jgi:DNA-binding NarL/FixJ family response regulator
LTLSNQKIRIAVAEDHHVTSEGLRSWFSSSSDFAVVGSCSERGSILSLVASSKPDILLLDMHMPGDISIKEVLKAVRQSGIRIVIFSADNRPFFVQIALDCGVQAYLLKSESFQAVAEVLRRVFNGESGLTSKDLLKPSPISQSEKEIIALLARGRKYQEIADERGTTSETVRKQCDKIIMKLGVSNREELIVWAIEQGYGGN